MSDAAPQQAEGDSRSISDGLAEYGELASGGTVPGLSRPAYTLQRVIDPIIPVLIAVPHAGRAYPPRLLDMMRHGEDAAHRLEDRFIDLVGRAAAQTSGAGLLVAHAPRAMIDLNRDTADLDNGMFVGRPPSRQQDVPDLPRQQPRAQRGLGLFPRRLPTMGELWRNPMLAEEAERRIAAIHRPYHTQLDAELQRLRDRFGHAILIDLHSMPSLPPRGDLPGASHVVGDRFGASCASAVAAAAMDLLNRTKLACAYNRPYAGGYVLDRHGRPRRNIHAMQLEIDRARYLDDYGQPEAVGVDREANLVSEMAGLLASVLAADGWGLDQAAE